MNAQMEASSTAGWLCPPPRPAGKHVARSMLQTDAAQSCRSNFKSGCRVPQSIKANAWTVAEENKAGISIMLSVLELQHITER